MLQRLRPFLTALACTWIALLAAALFYSKQHTDSHWIVQAALPAFVVEAIFYLASVFEETREWFRLIRSPRLQALLLWTSALIPYLLFTTLAGTFNQRAFEAVAILTGVLSYWFVLLPRRPAYDVGFLVVAAAPVVMRVFSRIYAAPPGPHIGIDVLGHLTWVRLAIAALLILRHWDPGAFGLWPNAAEWRTGALFYLSAIVPIVLVALALRYVHFAVASGAWWLVAGRGVGTFFGILWTVALGEDLLFRGVIERALLDRWSSPISAILISAALFGAVHLWFPHFPDWQRAAVVTVLGIACGVVYWQSRSVRASMVTHALVVTTWRMFFAS